MLLDLASTADRLDSIAKKLTSDDVGVTVDGVDALLKEREVVVHDLQALGPAIAAVLEHTDTLAAHAAQVHHDELAHGKQRLEQARMNVDRCAHAREQQLHAAKQLYQFLDECTCAHYLPACARGCRCRA